MEMRRLVEDRIVANNKTIGSKQISIPSVPDHSRTSLC
jgi:hypothetical protein